MRLVELCAGTGGFTLAFAEHNHVKSIWANDMINESEIIYKHNFPDVPFVRADLMDYPIEQIPAMDILTAGFPCQPFSILGKQLGLNDKRSHVFGRIVQIIEHHKPRFVMLENVKNLTHIHKGALLQAHLKMLTDIGYKVEWQVFDTRTLTGLPQRRKRLYIVAFRDTLDHTNFQWPKPVDEQIDILSLLQPLNEVDQKYLLLNNVRKQKLYHILLNGVIDNVRSTRMIYIYTYHQIRKNIGVCPTIVKWHNVISPHINDNGVQRALTHRELFNLQGFNQTYKLPSELTSHELYDLVGNAISVPVARMIADQIIAASLALS